MPDKFIIKEFENLDDMAEAIKELAEKVIFSKEDEDLGSYSLKRAGRDGRMKDYGSVATQHFLMAYAQLRAAEASMKLCIQRHYLDIDVDRAEKAAAIAVSTMINKKYPDMTAKQIVAAMKNESQSQD